MSLNFYKSKIFIALAVCLGSIGISQSNVYAQRSVEQGNPYPATGEAEFARGLKVVAFSASLLMLSVEWMV